QIANPMGLRHLVKDFYAVATLGSVLECNFNTAHGILDVDEGAGLTARAVYGKRIANGRLDEETVQYRAVIAVIIEAVDELLVKARFLRMRAPDDTLVQVGDTQAVILGIVLEQQLIQALGHMVDGARIGRVKDFLRDR